MPQIRCRAMDLRFHMRNVICRNVSPFDSLWFLGSPAGGATLFSVANFKQKIGFLSATFLLGLGAVEMMLHLIGA